MQCKSSASLDGTANDDLKNNTICREISLCCIAEHRQTKSILRPIDLCKVIFGGLLHTYKLKYWTMS